MRLFVIESRNANGANDMNANQAVANLELAAQKAGSALDTINGRKVVCRIRVQTRNGRQVHSAYWEMDGKRAKFPEVSAAVNK